MNCDQSVQKFEDFILRYDAFKEADLSESDTRSKLIDYLLIDVLGWTEEDILREGHIDSGFFDYRISIAGFSMVVEAKRQFLDFVLPNTSRRVKLSTLYKENKEVIDQIRKYLDDLGQDIGVITNGRQVILAKFINTNGIPWKNNYCIIYNGIEDIKNNYIEFWNTLSKESIIERGGIVGLQDGETSFSKTILSTIPQKDNEISRNDLSSKITPIISRVFGEIFNTDEDNDDEEFIRECYVENVEVKKNKAELNGLFSDNPPKLSNVVKARNYDSVTEQIKGEIAEEKIVTPKSPTPKPIIIIGSRGAGKTTFINFLFRHNVEGTVLNRFPYVIVNLMNYYDGTDILDTDKIAKDILEQFNDKYPERNINGINVLKRIYLKEINEKNKGVWKYAKENAPDSYEEKLSVFLEGKLLNAKEHLIAMNQYFVREIQRRAIIVFDNADQMNESIQEQVFLYACSLNTQGKFGTIISIREGYYYKFKDRPPFNAFDSHVFHIASPDYGMVLQRRIDYAIKTVDEEDENKEVIGTINDKTFKLDKKNIKSFFVGIRDSLFGVDNSPILDFLRFTTFPNIREGLNVFRLFLMSGYTDVSKYVLRVVFNKDSHRITIPLHEFAQAVGLENKLYYNHESSIIPNLFYPVSPKSDYFLKINILRYLEGIKQFKGDDDSYVKYETIMSSFAEFGYREDVFNQELVLLLNKGFVDTDNRISDIKWYSLDNAEFGISITAKGYYYLTKVINQFYYIDLVLQDTPICNEDTFSKIRSVFPMRDEEHKRDLDKRLETVESFLDYLREEEQKAPRGALTQFGSLLEQLYSTGLRNDIDRIKAMISKLSSV